MPPRKTKRFRPRDVNYTGSRIRTKRTVFRRQVGRRWCSSGSNGAVIAKRAVAPPVLRFTPKIKVQRRLAVGRRTGGPTRWLRSTISPATANYSPRFKHLSDTRQAAEYFARFPLDTFRRLFLRAVRTRRHVCRDGRQRHATVPNTYVILPPPKKKKTNRFSGTGLAAPKYRKTLWIGLGTRDGCFFCGRMTSPVLRTGVLAFFVGKHRALLSAEFRRRPICNTGPSKRDHRPSRTRTNELSLNRFRRRTFIGRSVAPIPISYVIIKQKQKYWKKTKTAKITLPRAFKYQRFRPENILER